MSCAHLVLNCSVSKQIAPRDPAPQDLDLNTNLFVLWGVSDSVSQRSPTGGLATHRPGSNPAASDALTNPSTGVTVTVSPPVSQKYKDGKKNHCGCVYDI